MSPEPWNAQLSYLAGLISLVHVQRRRSRADDVSCAHSHDCNFTYMIGQCSGDSAVDILVCKKGCIA